MKLIDLYYRVFKSLRAETKDDMNSQKLRRLIAYAGQKSEFFKTTKFECSIEEDWIKNIEEGLVYVEKAIWEERQFIRTHGEVVPIEKVKKVSKASITHLSRHSEFITRIPKLKSNNIIPDKLYIVEKLTDYLVYENRFIYMLLLYLRDFIQIRLDKIKDKTTTYRSEMLLDKQIELNQRHLNYQLQFSEKLENDTFLLQQYKEIPLVNRMENLYAIVISFLATPLMKEVAKAPMLKPPIVKTNVLRMNPNFRMALNLYDFVMSYNKDGFELKEVEQTHNPLPHELADEIAETIELSSILTYVETDKRRDYFEEIFEKSERDRLEAINKKHQEEIRVLNKRLVEMKEDPAKYILRLEKRNVELEEDSIKYYKELEKNGELLIQIDTLEQERSNQKEDIEQLSSELILKENEINRLNQKYFDDMTNAEKIHKQEISRFRLYYQDKIEKLIEEHKRILKETIDAYELKLQETIDAYELKLQETIDTYEAEIIRLTDMYEKKLEETMATYEAEIKYLTEMYETKLEETIDNYESELKELHETQETVLKETKENHRTEITQINEVNDEKTKQIIDAHYEEINNLVLAQEEQLNQEIETHENIVTNLLKEHKQQRETYENETNSLKDTANSLEQKMKEIIADYDQQMNENTAEINSLRAQLKKLNEEKQYANAQYLAIKAQQGLITKDDEYTNKERFKQLEKEMAAYKKHFKTQWKKTKVKIREQAKNNVFDEKDSNEKEGDDYNQEPS